MTVLFWWILLGIIGSILWSIAERDMFFCPGIYSGSVFSGILWRTIYPILIGPMGFVMGVVLIWGDIADLWDRVRWRN